MITGWLSWNGEKILVTYVYAKWPLHECRELWMDLENLTSYNYPWIVIGDFNYIRSDSERLGGQPRPLAAMSKFNNSIDKCGLVDLNNTGGNMS